MKKVMCCKKFSDKLCGNRFVNSTLIKGIYSTVYFEKSAQLFSSKLLYVYRVILFNVGVM